MSKYPLVSIMILGWNNYGDIIDCLKSLKSINYSNYNIVLVDNGSEEKNFKNFESWLVKTKSTYSILDNNLNKNNKEKSISGKIFILKNTANLGFAGGSNVGLRFTWRICNPEYLLLLNGDTCVTKEFLGSLVDVCEKNDKIGSAQSVLLRFDKKTIDSLGLEMQGYRVFDVAGGESSKEILKNLEEVREIFGACGASALYRADLIRKIGLFDQSLFATFEDFDLAWRIRLSGFKTVLVKKSVTYHRGGVSRFKKDHIMFDMRTYYGAKNSLVMFNKYYPMSWKILITTLARLAIGLIAAVKNKRTLDFIAQLHHSRRERKEIFRNKRLSQIQKEWIKR